jgi:hypothetical protein
MKIEDVIPAKAGIQYYQWPALHLDPPFKPGDDRE